MHLLKQDSKPSKPRKERKKFDLYEAPAEPKLVMPKGPSRNEDTEMKDESQWKDANQFVKSKSKRTITKPEELQQWVIYFCLFI